MYTEGKKKKKKTQKTQTNKQKKPQSVHFLTGEKT